jgi:hypothetical protein
MFAVVRPPPKRGSGGGVGMEVGVVGRVFELQHLPPYSNLLLGS